MVYRQNGWFFYGVFAKTLPFSKDLVGMNLGESRGLLVDDELGILLGSCWGHSIWSFMNPMFDNSEGFCLWLEMELQNLEMVGTPQATQRPL